MACWGEDGMHGIIIISNWSGVLLGEIRSRQVQFRNALQQQFRLQICSSCIAWAVFVACYQRHLTQNPWHILVLYQEVIDIWRCFGWFQKKNKMFGDSWCVLLACGFFFRLTFAPRWFFVATEFPWSANACIAYLRQSVGVSASNTSWINVPR